MFAAKWIWGIGILLAVSLLLWRSREDIVAMLGQLPLWMLAASFVPLLAAKFLLGENARIAANRSGISIGYVDATRLYNLSQLGKYLPGSIWQFVGRAAAYRSQFGASFERIRNSLLTESLWVVGAAFVVGGVLCGAPLWKFLVNNAPTGLLWWLTALVGMGLMVAAVLFATRRRALLHYARSAIPTPRALIVQAGVWLLLGLSFWILVRACGMQAGLLFSIGLFAGGYALGFLVPFAPAGLGIRDAVLTVGLLPYAPMGEALAVTVVARLVYLTVDLLIVVLQDPLFRMFGRMSGNPAQKS
jgi:glycosyltransferase 2 family protein